MGGQHKARDGDGQAGDNESFTPQMVKPHKHVAATRARVIVGGEKKKKKATKKAKKPAKKPAKKAKKAKKKAPKKAKKAKKKKKVLAEVPESELIAADALMSQMAAMRAEPNAPVEEDSAEMKATEADMMAYMVSQQKKKKAMAARALSKVAQEEAGPSPTQSAYMELAQVPPSSVFTPTPMSSQLRHEKRAAPTVELIDYNYAATMADAQALLDAQAKPAAKPKPIKYTDGDFPVRNMAFRTSRLIPVVAAKAKEAAHEAALRVAANAIYKSYSSSGGKANSKSMVKLSTAAATKAADATEKAAMARVEHTLAGEKG